MPRMLALSCGGDRACILVGMVHAIFEDVKEDSADYDNVKYDKISGISAGALVGAMVAQMTKDNVTYILDQCKNIFESNTFHVVEPWICGGTIINVLYAIGWCESLFNNTALKELLDTHYTQKPTMEFTVGALNTNDKTYKTFHKEHSSFKDCILASASVPVVFPSVLIDGEKYEDGGMGHIIPIPEIQKFIQDNEGEHIKIDVLCCYPIHDCAAFFGVTVIQTSYALIRKLSETVAETQWHELIKDLITLSKLESDTVTIRIIHPKGGTYSTFMSVDKSLCEQMFEEGKKAVKQSTVENPVLKPTLTF